jgi:hypothetical protein
LGDDGNDDNDDDDDEILMTVVIPSEDKLYMQRLLKKVNKAAARANRMEVPKVLVFPCKLAQLWLISVV